MKNYKKNLEIFISNIESNTIKKNYIIVGYMDDDIIKFLYDKKGICLSNFEIRLSVKAYKHSIRDFKKKINKNVDKNIILNIYKYLKKPNYIFYDNLEKHKNLMYICEFEGQLFKIIINTKNNILTLGKINKEDLKDKFLEKIR